MTKSVGEIERQIAELQKQREIAQIEEDRLKALSVEYRAAIIMHNCQCNSDHTEGCGWYYEVHKNVHDFGGSSHKWWVAIATTVVRRLQHALGPSSDEQVLKILEAVLARK